MRKTVIGPDVGSDLELFDGVEGVDGLPHSEAVAVELPEYTRVFVSGTGAIDEHGDVVAPGDPAAQLRTILESIEEMIERVDGDMRDVVRMTVLTEKLTEDEYLDVCRVRQSFLVDGHEPASLMNETDDVGVEDMCLEVEADAIVPRNGWDVEHVER
jgi:enamine deaminase RidA (YjgF/YER057c/UK114 family)